VYTSLPPKYAHKSCPEIEKKIKALLDETDPYPINPSFDHLCREFRKAKADAIRWALESGLWKELPEVKKMAKALEYYADRSGWSVRKDLGRLAQETIKEFNE